MNIPEGRLWVQNFSGRCNPWGQRMNESEERTCRELLAKEGITVTDEEVKLYFPNPFLDDNILLLFKGVFAFAFGIFE